MAETVYLAPTDEIASIKSKMDRARGNPIILVAPKKTNALANPLALKLIKRHAEHLGKDLVLVAASSKVRNLALYHGVPVYSSYTQVRHWRPRSRAESSAGGRQALSLPKASVNIGAAGFTVAFLFLIAAALPFVVGYFVVPSATITLYTTAKPLSENIGVNASAEAREIDVNSGTIPGRLVETYFELTDQLEIAGKKPVPDASATGQATFINKIDTKVTVPKGALLATKSGIKFRTVDEVSLPASKGAVARTTIIADQPGKAGNVEKQTIDQVLDLQLSSQVFVVNENPTQGGTDKEVGAVTADDRAQLKTQATTKAKNEAFQKLLTTKTPSESIYAQTVNVQIIDEQFDRKIGEETKTLGIKLVVKGTGLAFEAKDVNELVSRTLEKKVPKGMKISGDGIKIKPLGAEKWTDRSVTFYAQADAKAMATIDEDQIKRDLAGKGKGEAEKYLAETLALADSPDVRIEPGWNDVVPRFDWRIKINSRTP